MLSKISFSVISLLVFSSPSLAVHRGVFSQTCHQYTSHGVVRHGAQGVCINDCAAISLGEKPGILTRGPVPPGRVQDGGCSAGKNGQTPCNVNASEFGMQGTSCDEYPYASTQEGAASGSPSVLRCIPTGENSSGGQQLTQFYRRLGVQPGDTFDVAFIWGQPMFNQAGQQVGTTPPIPAAVARMCHAQQPTNDGLEFRMNLTTHFFRRFTSVFRRTTTELRAVTAERKSPVAEPIWLRTGRNLTIMAYGNIKLGTPVWSDLYGKDEVARIIDSSDPEYPPKLSTKTTGNESGGVSTKATGGKSTKMTGAAPTAPAKSAATKAKATGSLKSAAKSTKPAVSGRAKVQD